MQCQILKTSKGKANRNFGEKLLTNTTTAAATTLSRYAHKQCMHAQTIGAQVIKGIEFQTHCHFAA